MLEIVTSHPITIGMVIIGLLVLGASVVGWGRRRESVEIKIKIKKAARVYAPVREAIEMFAKTLGKARLPADVDHSRADQALRKEPEQRVRQNLDVIKETIFPHQPPGESPADLARSPGSILEGPLGGLVGSPNIRMEASDPRVVDMLFATSRQAEIMTSRVSFTSGRAENLFFGSLRVRVPEDHKIGRIELPHTRNFILFKLTQSVDEKKHFIIRDITLFEHERFVELVRSAERKDVLVFVHGFNNSFDEAAFRLAQIAFDMGYQGLPVLFSWAAANGVHGYRHDIDSARLAKEEFVELLHILQNEADVKTIHIIAHSMGNAVVMEALDKVAGEKLPVRVAELIMAAPDVSRDLFIKLAKRVNTVAKGMTLYASSKDRALVASKALALNIPRAGDVPPEGPIVLPGMDTIDVSTFGEEFLGLNHSTFASNRSLIDDIGRLVLLGQRPPGLRTPQLKGRPEAANPPLYWHYPN
jgi:esterase/lipase superfamily enzyme